MAWDPASGTLARQLGGGRYAFGCGRPFITRRLLEAGREVRTLTGHPGRPDPFDGKVSVLPYAFDDPAALAAVARHYR